MTWLHAETKALIRILGNFWEQQVAGNASTYTVQHVASTPGQIFACTLDSKQKLGLGSMIVCSKHTACFGKQVW